MTTQVSPTLPLTWPMDMYNNSVEEYTELKVPMMVERMLFLEPTSSMTSSQQAIGDIQLSYDNNTNIETFTVDFQVQYISIGDSLQSSQGNVGEVQIS